MGILLGIWIVFKIWCFFLGLAVTILACFAFFGWVILEWGIRRATELDRKYTLHSGHYD